MAPVRRLAPVVSEKPAEPRGWEGDDGLAYLTEPQRGAAGPERVCAGWPGAGTDSPCHRKRGEHSVGARCCPLQIKNIPGSRQD